MRLLSACRAKGADCIKAVIDLYAVAKLLWHTGRNLYETRRMRRATSSGSAALAKKRLGG